MDDVERGFRQRFWDILCEYDLYLKIALSATVLLVVLLLLALPGISTSDESFVILVLDFAILGPTIVVILFLVWRCSNREREESF